MTRAQLVLLGAALLVTVGLRLISASVAVWRRERALAKRMQARYRLWHESHDWIGPSERTR